ncbi:hypothetical protein C3731_07630 [Brucella oryzae]|uniref:Uncharacterized protein n=1 Tax=Brucella oryzae TaxID=335286 RepID=A0A2S7J249_9HYPH|nr:hypothetical protein C3731_07630 [Brucella oryzae]PWU75351.1 hypothetical protein DK867_06280 [Ochrobactrum sp. POC9]
MKVYPPDLRLNRVRIDCQRIRRKRPYGMRESRRHRTLNTVSVFSALPIRRRAAILDRNQSFARNQGTSS